MRDTHTHTIVKNLKNNSKRDTERKEKIEKKMEKKSKGGKKSDTSYTEDTELKINRQTKKLTLIH